MSSCVAGATVLTSHNSASATSSRSRASAKSSVATTDVEDQVALAASDRRDGGVERCVELIVGLLGAQTLGECPGEAAIMPFWRAKISFDSSAAVPGKGHDLQHLRVADEIGVEVVDARQRQLQHHFGAVVERIEIAMDAALSISSHSTLVGLWMSTSGSMIGIRP